MKKWTLSLVVLLALSVVAIAANDTEYEAATDATAEVTFGPDPYGVVTILDGDIVPQYNGTLKIYAKGGAGRVTPSSYPSVATNVIPVSNSSYALTNSDIVVWYDTSADVSEKRTISSATTTNVTLDSAVTSIPATGDQLYEVTQQGQIDITTNDTNEHLALRQYTFVSPADSPVYMIASTGGGANSNVTMTVTVDR